MNEGLRIHLQKNGKALNITTATMGSGLIIDGETDSSPRDFHLEFAPSSRVTALRTRHVQRRHGWDPWEFRLSKKVNWEGVLEFGPVVPEGLPSGHYWIRTRLEDLIIDRGKRNLVTIEKDAVTDVILEARDDPRQVELTKHISAWDKEISRVLQSPESSIDGHQADSWLLKPDSRARRKACLLNVLASLRSRPMENGSLLGTVLNVFHVEVDRVYSAVTADLYRLLLELSEDPKKPFFREGEPTAPIHRRLLDRAGERFRVVTSTHTLQSFRAEGGPSLQINVAIPPGAASEHFAEFDLDLGNPLQDVNGFVIHIGELLDSGRTDHLSLHERLSKTNAGEFLYYRVKNA